MMPARLLIRTVVLLQDHKQTPRLSFKFSELPALSIVPLLPRSRDNYGQPGMRARRTVGNSGYLYGLNIFPDLLSLLTFDLTLATPTVFMFNTQ